MPRICAQGISEWAVAKSFMLSNDPRSGLADRYQIENNCLLSTPVFDEIVL